VNHFSSVWCVCSLGNTMVANCRRNVYNDDVEYAYASIRWMMSTRLHRSESNIENTKSVPQLNRTICHARFRWQRPTDKRYDKLLSSSIFILSEVFAFFTIYIGIWRGTLFRIVTYHDFYLHFRLHTMIWTAGNDSLRVCILPFFLCLNDNQGDIEQVEIQQHRN
jgi:hypothetical protein